MVEMTLGQKIAKQLVDEIVRGALKPGERLDEQALANRFNVSRTPIRDALRELMATRLVEQVPRRGVSVARVDIVELRNLFETYSELEALCGRYCALRADAVERARIQDIHEQCAEAVNNGDTQAYAEANRALHRAIHESCHNSALRDITLEVRNRLSAFRARFLFTPERIISSHKEHEAIVSCILKNDADGASEAMKHHTSRTALSIVKQLAPLSSEPETNKLFPKMDRAIPL